MAVSPIKAEFFCHPHSWGAHKTAMAREAAFQHLKSTDKICL